MQTISNYKKVICGIVFIVFLSIQLFFVAFAQTVNELEQKIAQLTKQIKELEEKEAQYKSLLATKTREVLSLENTISFLTTQIQKLEIEINKTTINIKRLEYEIKAFDIKINEILKKISFNKQKLASLIKEIYKHSNISFLEMFLKNKTFSEFFNQKENLNSIYKKIRSLTEELKLTQIELKDAQNKIKEKKNDLEKSKQKLSFLQEDILNQKIQKNKILTETKGQQKNYEKIISQIQQEEANLRREIAKLEQLVLKSKNFVLYVKASNIPPKGTKIFIYPQDDPIITQNYGMTSYARTGVYGGKGHNGIDMSSGFGSDVKAAAKGKVIAKNLSNCPNFAKTYEERKCAGGWGNWVAIEHDGGLVTVYAHLYKVSHKNVGDIVNAGEIIGKEGSSGFSTGSHLHFSVYSEFFTFKSPTGELLFRYGDGEYPTGTLNPFDYL